jgi:hypothetical protein
MMQRLQLMKKQPLMLLLKSQLLRQLPPLQKLKRMNKQLQRLPKRLQPML